MSDLTREQVEVWAAVRADDAGRLATALLAAWDAEAAATEVMRQALRRETDLQARLDEVVEAAGALLRAEREYARIMLDPAYGVEGRVAARQRKGEADDAYHAVLNATKPEGSDQ